MSSIMNFINRTFQKQVTQGALDRASLLKTTMTAGWGLSCLGQVGAIALNDKVPGKEKKFLIPQEILDGIINVSLFWLCTSKAENFGKLATLSGRMLTKGLSKLDKSIFKFADKLNLNSSGAEFKSTLENITKQIGKVDPKQAKEFTKFYNASGVVAGLTGSVLSCSIFTPFVRNKLAAIFQKKSVTTQPEVKTTYNKQISSLNKTNPVTPFPKRAVANNFAIARSYYNNLTI